MERGILETLSARLSALTAGSQHNRLLRLEFPRQDGPHSLLLVNRLHADEEVSRDFHFQVEVLSDDAGIPLASVLGKMVTISLVRVDGSLRYFNGYVTQFRHTHANGGFAFYEMVLEPWLALTKYRKNCQSFLNRSVLEITEDILQNYEFRDWNYSFTAELPPLTCVTQYNESDHNYLHRRWEEFGLHYWYEHRADGHTLWLSDNTTTSNFVDGAVDDSVPVSIEFRSQSGSEEGDGICRWLASQQVESAITTLASYDFKKARQELATMGSLTAGGEGERFESYEDESAYGFKNADDGESLARRRMEEIDSRRRYFHASGNARVVQAGRSFALSGHYNPAVSVAGDEGDLPRGAEEFFIIRTTHTATNNYHVGAASRSEYANDFTCIPKEIPWRPGLGFNSGASPYPGLLTATVVGPHGQEIYTDGYGSVKVQFHWDRTGQRDENSSAWVRVAMPMAGDTFGHSALPRVGQEVLVDFLGKNIDRPIIIGLVHNASNLPPWNLPSQHVLSGIRSRELGGGSRGNHLLFDDTREQLQVQLRSDHEHSQLSLGHITRVEDSTGRHEHRGEGWELRTDARGTARAGSGMLITTEPRLRAEQHITSMDKEVERLSNAEAFHRNLSSAAVRSGAQEAGQQDRAAEAIAEQNSKFTKVKPAEEGGGEFQAPHLMLASPSGIATTTSGATHIASETHTLITSGSSLSIAAAQWFGSITDTFRLFVQKAGMKFVAAQGKISLRARSDDIDVIAKKVLHLLSESDWVQISGKKGVRIQGAGSLVEISDSVQFFTSSPTQFHGNLETLPSASSAAVENEATPEPDEVAAVLQDSAVAVPVAKIESIAFLDGSEQKEVQSARQWVNLTKADKFAIGTDINIDRVGRHIRLRVRFDRPGSHRFSVKCVPHPANTAYSASERIRNNSFRHQENERAYQTTSDGTLILPLHDFFVSAAGKCRYVFEAKDSAGTVVRTGELETYRLIYFVELKMRGLLSAASGLRTLTEEFGKHNVTLVDLPPVDMQYLANVNSRVRQENEQLMDSVCDAYAKSEALRRPRRVIAMAYTDHLAIKRERFVVQVTNVAVGPGCSPVRTVTAASGMRFLWKDIVPGEDWFISATFTAAGTGAHGSIPIARTALTAVADDPREPMKCSIIVVNVDQLPAAHGSISIEVNIVEAMAGGLAYPNSNLIAICTKAWWRPVSTAEQNRAMIHEFGHKMWLVPDGTHDRPDKSSTWYDDAKGHRGPHCFYGLPSGQSRYDSAVDAASAKCVMYGKITGHSAFCPNCSEAVRKMDLSAGWDPIYEQE
ncbi:type VI secretion system Vgr family protein [Pseudoduganella sp. GCM10020061]|uniref:type VI secretion system Vgr family protein n=1 Tax=Pseudoduganella sp. GCM10020061 TaxID=3317345 RepID=UPI00362918A2